MPVPYLRLLVRMGSWRALAGWQLSGDYLLFFMYRVKCGPSGPPFIFVLLIFGRKRFRLGRGTLGGPLAKIHRSLRTPMDPLQLASGVRMLSRIMGVCQPLWLCYEDLNGSRGTYHVAHGCAPSLLCVFRLHYLARLVGGSMGRSMVFRASSGLRILRLDDSRSRKLRTH